ncbi:lysine--tRNA ligase [Thermomicrobium sp. 4228-Ro]|uniref:lysine--tRNA ligase n=1 Tax=Thermomicrobium sp. 4228-Ro TaxID=2993937 RepID=UPI0022490D8A|nr:lysine--tRNA ligase [Thermomicrobium sp. 4228-Ro]MCX2726049.1 lysine--tRNA ligase [Thermomicrobium sp. 4228-Ro]
MTLNDQQRARLEKLRELRLRGIDPYPPHSGRSMTTHEAVQRFLSVESELAGEPDPECVTLAGRVVSIRDMGRTVFSHIRDGAGTIQLYLRREIVGDEQLAWFKRYVDLNDFVEADGHLFRTRTGEVSLQVTALRLLAKAINPPPDKWHGLTDVETRYRQRYVDLMTNPETRQVFVTRAQVIRAIRRYLDERGFLEVETPTLQPVYGGAAARPFTTYYHALDQTYYLRISDELYLKRLIVGGYDRVYEICKDFRNEGIDARHNPEFTMLEFYVAYADYRDIMQMCEELIVYAAQEALGTLQIPWGTQTIDLTPPWTRLSLRDAILRYTGIDFFQITDQPSLYARAMELGADVRPDTVWPRILDELLRTFVRPNLIQPTFLYDYPVALSPLAKRKPDDPRLVERFQLFVGGLELANAYSELNDPLDQLFRFLEQARDRARGDEEAMPIDEDFINALMYGMPPTGGFGLGIDRLVMLLTNRQTIREVILFPQLRSKPEPLGLTEDLRPYLDLVPGVQGSLDVDDSSATSTVESTDGTDTELLQRR